MHKDETNPLKNDYRNVLTLLLSYYNLPGMARFKDIVASLGSQTFRKSDELSKELAELNALRPSWQRYQELAKQIESKERSVKIGLALLLHVPLKINTEADAFEGAQELEADAERLAINLDDLDLSSFSLWRVIREVVRQTGSIRVYELEAHLKQFGVKKATRPAIESALVTHSKEFRITRKGREKFVELR